MTATSRHRPLLPNLANVSQPHPHGAGAAAGPVAAPTQERRATRKGACEACRRRKSKCNGALPICQVCLSKDSKCIYIVDTNSANLKTKNASLKKDLSSMLELFWDLQTKSALEAKDLLDRIRAGEDVSVLARAGNLQSLHAQRDEQAAQAQEQAELTPRSSLEPDVPDSYSNSSTTQSLEKSSLDTTSHSTPPADEWDDLRGGIQQTDSPSSSVDVSTVLGFPMPDADTFKAAISYFYECTGSLFHSFTKEEGEEMVAELAKNGTGRMPKTVLCEICSLAAIASLYSRGKIAPHLTGSFYSIAKQFLDDAIEADPVRAMKVCLLLAMYNIVHKGTVALAYAELGLRLAHRQGLYGKQRLAGMAKAKWVDSKQVFRTLMFSKSWLSATLGYVSNDGFTAEMRDPYEDDLEGELTMDDVVQIEISKITTLKAQLLRTLFTTTDLSVEALRTVKDGLGNWYNTMPSQIKMGNLASEGFHAVGKVAVFFIHLQHLGALMLVQRRIMLFFAHSTAGDFYSQQLISEATQSGEESLIAAKQSARILELLLDGDSLFNKCWLGIFQSYTSCTIILYGIAQKLLYNHPSQDMTGDLLLAQKTLRVLKHCAKCDNVAKHFHETLQIYYDVLSAVTVEDVRELLRTSTGTPPVAEYFFTLRPGSSKVHAVARDLFKLICQPFRSNPGLAACEGSAFPISDTQIYLDEISLGVHQDWKWEEDSQLSWRGVDDAEEPSLALEIFLNRTPGYWLDSTAPSGWNGSSDVITCGMPGSLIGF